MLCNFNSHKKSRQRNDPDLLHAVVAQIMHHSGYVNLGSRVGLTENSCLSIFSYQAGGDEDVESPRVVTVGNS